MGGEEDDILQLQTTQPEESAEEDYADALDEDDQESESEEEEEEEESAKPEKWKKHYSSRHRILLVGEGDFSFSLCLARAFGSARNLVATSIDSQGQSQYKQE